MLLENYVCIHMRNIKFYFYNIQKMNLIQINKFLKPFWYSVKNYNKKCWCSLLKWNKLIELIEYPDRTIPLNPDEDFWGNEILDMITYSVLSHPEELTENELKIFKKLEKELEKELN